MNVTISDRVSVGADQPLLVIAGPCVIESRDFTLHMAEELKAVCAERDVGFVFKSSFDKANRSSIESFRGQPIEAGLEILQEVHDVVGVPTITDVHETWQVAPTAEVVDIIQIPAFLCRQTDLLVAAAKSGRVVNVKKGQFLAPWEMRHVVKKLEDAGSNRVLVTERGTSFGYNTLVVDFRSLPQLKALGYPTIFDATHSVQQPGGLDGSSGGQREFVPHLARAAAAVGIDGLFLEVHDDPDNAPSDGPNMIRLDDLGRLLDQVLAVRSAVER